MYSRVIFVCCSLFCEFLDFVHFPEFLVLVSFVLCKGLPGAPTLASHVLRTTIYTPEPSDLLLLPPSTPHQSTPPTQPHPTTSQPHHTTFHSRPHTRPRTFQDQHESTRFNQNCGGDARRSSRTNLKHMEDNSTRPGDTGGGV